MIQRIETGLFLYDGKTIVLGEGLLSPSEVKSKLRALGYVWDLEDSALDPANARKETMADRILCTHNQSKEAGTYKIKFDSLASHDITYVGVIQTARASGLMQFPVPYVLTNCHNSLCAVGGTINEDDHIFGLSAAQKYGGIFVPAHQAVIHQVVRELHAGCGKMILGSDSHTRYGAIGTLGIGEGGPEIVKQLLNNTYDINAPEVVLVYLTGNVQKGVGPQDVALSIIKEVFHDGFVKNKILEFCGPGIENLSMDFRIGIDVMTTETTCLSSIWETDAQTEQYLNIHGRPKDYEKLSPGKMAYYDAGITVDLDLVEPVIALPFHPSTVYTIKELNENPYDILKQIEQEASDNFSGQDIGLKLTDKIKDGALWADQGIIAGCSGGTFENICEAAAILKNQDTGNSYFGLSVYPSSQPVNMALTKNGAIADLMATGAIIRTAFCGPCFGAGDTPGNNCLSIRHTTRNFPNREGSKPDMGQISSVALMDARSIAATALNGGRLTPGTEVDIPDFDKTYVYDPSIYEKRIYNGYQKPKKDVQLRFGPNIADWPQMPPMADDLLLKIASVITDTVTTTDELIPSGETSSYRSNPYKLAEFTLSRKDPQYVGRAKETQGMESERRKGQLHKELAEVLAAFGASNDKLMVGSAVYANKPGDGSAREQAASCQKVLGGLANIAKEYATKRYRSNLINWGMVPFTVADDGPVAFKVGDYVYIQGFRQAILNHQEVYQAKVLSEGVVFELPLYVKGLGETEREILLKGSLINYYANSR